MANIPANTPQPTGLASSAIAPVQSTVPVISGRAAIGNASMQGYRLAVAGDGAVSSPVEGQIFPRGK